MPSKKLPSSDFSLILLAAGDSKRFSSKNLNCNSKLLYNLDGISVINRCIANFINLSFIGRIVVAVKSEDKDFFRRELQSFTRENKKPIYIIDGSDSRSKSSKNAMLFVDSLNWEKGYVLISDAARYNTSSTLVERVALGLLKSSTAIPCIRHEETLKVIKNGKIKSFIKEENLFEIQTPQGYLFPKLLEAFKSPSFSGSENDESELYFKHFKDEKFNIVLGDINNVKLTRKPYDKN